MEVKRKDKPRWVTTVEVSVNENVPGTDIMVRGIDILTSDVLKKGVVLYNARVDDLRSVVEAYDNNRVRVSLDYGGKKSTAWREGDILHILRPCDIEEKDDETG